MAEQVTSIEYINPSTGERQWRTRVVSGGTLFTPSSYDADVTIVAGTASTGALATNVKLGEGKVNFVNQGTGDIRIAFGTSATDAVSNLTIAGGVATTGYYLEDVAAWGSAASVLLGVPALATHYAICNATATETPTVSVNQSI